MKKKYQYLLALLFTFTIGVWMRHLGADSQALYVVLGFTCGIMTALLIEFEE